MTRDDIIELAREAGIDAESDTLFRYEGWVKPLQRFAVIVAAAEREACAKVCDRMPDLVDGWRANLPSDCAAAIRARGEE